MDESFYIFEHGDGMSWTKRIVPASCCSVSVDHRGTVRVLLINETLCFNAVQNMRHVSGASVCEALAELRNSREGQAPKGQSPFEVAETVNLASVLSDNSSCPTWYELRFGKFVLAKIRCWSDENEPRRWQVKSADADSYLLTAQEFLSPIAAAEWFYKNHVAQST